MERPEVPLEQAQESIAHHAHGAEEKWIMAVALTAALLAVLAAITALLAEDYANEAMILQLQSRRSMEPLPGRKPSRKTPFPRKSSSSKRWARPWRTRRTPTNWPSMPANKRRFRRKPKANEKESKAHLHRHVVLARSLTMFQIGIAVAAIAVLTRGARAFGWPRWRWGSPASRSSSGACSSEAANGASRVFLWARCSVLRIIRPFSLAMAQGPLRKALRRERIGTACSAARQRLTARRRPRHIASRRPATPSDGPRFAVDGLVRRRGLGGDGPLDARVRRSARDDLALRRRAPLGGRRHRRGTADGQVVLPDREPALLSGVQVGLHGHGLGQPLRFSRACFPGAVLLALAALAAVLAAARIRGRASVLDVLIPVTLLHWGHYVNLIWGFQLCYVLPAVLTCGVVFLIASSHSRMSAARAVAVSLWRWRRNVRGARRLLFSVRRPVAWLWRIPALARGPARGCGHLAGCRAHAAAAGVLAPHALLGGA